MIPPLESIGRPRLVDSISERLRQLILSGDLGPGTKLLQTDLSERLGVSRTPLREALRILERDGLIRTANRNRTVEVVDPDPVDLLELYQVRQALEGLAAGLCAQRRLPQAELKTLTGLARKMERLSMPRQTDDYVRMHAEFHGVLVSASGNRRLHDIGPLYITMSSQKRLVRFITAHEPDRVDELMTYIDQIVSNDDADHRDLLAAIADGNARKAESIARRHQDRSIALVKRFLPAP